MEQYQQNQWLHQDNKLQKNESNPPLAHQDHGRKWFSCNLSTLNIPSNLDKSVEIIRTNGVFFRANYLIIILLLLLFNLLWQSMSLIVFVTMIIAWPSLYFLHGQIMIFGVVIQDQLVMVASLATTIVMLSVTSVTDKIVLALSTGAVAVFVHGALRATDDLVLLDPELGGEGTNTPLRDTASASYSPSM